LSRGPLAFGLNARRLDAGSFRACSLSASRFLTSGFLALRLQLDRRLSRGLLAFGLKLRGLDSRSFGASHFLANGFLALRFELGCCLSRRLLAFGLDSRCFLRGSLLPGSRLPSRLVVLCYIGGILSRRHDGLRARSARRCPDGGRWHRWGGGHDPCGLVGPRHGDHVRRGGRCRRRGTRSIGAQGRFRSVRTGCGVSL
jgi:hypothetical protein